MVLTSSLSSSRAGAGEVLVPGGGAKAPPLCSVTPTAVLLKRGGGSTSNAAAAPQTERTRPKATHPPLFRALISADRAASAAGGVM